MTDHRLPPLAAIRAFELSAKLGSFTYAADRLGLSQSAVTRQIAALEANLGAKLFHRGRRGVELTAEGEAYHRDVEPAFELLTAATARLRERRGEEVLRLRVYPIFAVKWLIPRLADLRAWAPDMRIELDTRVEPADFHRTTLDAAIQVGGAPRADIRSEALMADEIEPVCSPALLSGSDPVDLGLLERLPRLHARYRRADWRDWASSIGRPELGGSPSLEFPSSVLAYQAAQEGLGFTIGQTSLLQSDFERGVLVRPFGQPLRRARSYELLTPADREPPRRLRTFRAWLLNVVEQAGPPRRML